MYIPKQYRNLDNDEIRSFIEQNGFGILITQKDGKSLATHIPLVLKQNSDGDYILQSHISKANPQQHHFIDNSEVLCIFNGPHSYISSSWYDHENVPTWNYIAVHVYGTLKTIEGDTLYQAIKDLVDKYEVDSENPVKVEEFSEKTLEEIHGVIGLEIEIRGVQAAYKLSQNRDDKNHQNIISELSRKNNPDSKAIAEAMKKRYE